MEGKQYKKGQYVYAVSDYMEIGGTIIKVELVNDKYFYTIKCDFEEAESIIVREIPEIMIKSAYEFLSKSFAVTPFGLIETF